MEGGASSPKSPGTELQTDNTAMEGRRSASVEPTAGSGQSMEQMELPKAGTMGRPSSAGALLHAPQPVLEAQSMEEAASAHEDLHTLSSAATFNDSQSGSKSSSLQDIGSYFSPRIPDHSISTEDIAGLRTPPTPVTELREWPGSGLEPRHSLSANSLQLAKVEPDSPKPEAPEITWKESATQTVIGPSTIRAPTTRPTSVPILSATKSTNRRREGPEYPVYPDQSFAALQAQQHPRPCQPHPLRTRSSHPSQNSSFSSISSRQSRDFNMPTGAKTTGNTPAQSPGLFSPTFPRGRPDDPTRTPTLHPSHLQTPTETHKLLKDIDPVSGRKLINDYELIEKLGSGQHGTVKLGKNQTTGELVAVKIVRRFSKKVRLGRAGDPRDMIKKEVAILKKARHGNVVSLLEVIDDDEFEKVYLVLEYVSRGEIVWRKWADKDVAVFEMNRVKREKANQVNDSYEREQVSHFNEMAPTRRFERHQALREHKVSSFWSLEHGGDLDEEGETVYMMQLEPVLGSTTLSSSGHEFATAVMRDMSSEQSLAPQQEIPRSVPSDPQPTTPRPISAQSEVEQAMTELRLGSPSQLQGTMDSAYDSTDHASDTSLNLKLEKIFDAQTHWSEEEEEYQHVPCLTISQAQDAFRDTVLGLEYLHYQGIIHRDIKPANLLWTSDFRVKISDFGVSYLGKPIREDAEKEEIPEADAAIQHEAIELAKTVGTPAFYAPELCDPELFDFTKNPQRPQITGQIDVWALGVTLYCMIFGRLPFIDQSEMAMYEKIAREDVFISRLRLKGVEKSDDKLTTNSNKRLDDVIEYEEVGEELQDLLKRLLEKNPLKRISLKEVKHHPWVLSGIQDQGAWVDETDPSVQSEGRKIEVSNEDVQYAVVGLVDRVKNVFRRVGSVVRGREGRKRTDSLAKAPDSPSSAPPSKGYASGQDGRRSSLRGDEQIYTALRASREGSEHPLSQSVSASPELENPHSYFGNESRATSQTLFEDPQAARPTLAERTLSNAESTRTIRPAISGSGQAEASPPAFSSLTTVVDANTSSSLGGIFHGAGRRFVNSMRSRERGPDSASRSSRSSSAGGSSLGVEDPHASPSIAFSSASAAGHVDQPPVLREPSPAEARVPDLGIAATAADTPCPPSPDDAFFPGVGISSSSDQVGSGLSDSFSHPSVPSIVSGASSVSTDLYGLTPREREKETALVMPRNVSNDSQADEAGYNGEGEMDSDSDDDMLVMGGKK